MTAPRPLLVGLALALVTGLVPAQAQRAGLPALPRGRITVMRERRVVRIPLRPAAEPPRWKETRGPRCVERRDIIAAAPNGSASVDFLFRDLSRVRAKLKNSCPAIDYYAGFYLQPTPDGRVCADRDAVHARSGGECQVDAFRTLTPKPARARASR